MKLNFIPYKNRAGERVMVSRLTTVEQLRVAYYDYLEPNKLYAMVGEELTKAGKRVALNDYLVISDKHTFTETDGTFRRTYYPEHFTEEQVKQWLCLPELYITRFDTAEEALEEWNKSH